MARRNNKYYTANIILNGEGYYVPKLEGIILNGYIQFGKGHELKYSISTSTKFKLYKSSHFSIRDSEIEGDFILNGVNIIKEIERGNAIRAKIPTISELEVENKKQKTDSQLNWFKAAFGKKGFLKRILKN